MFKRGRLQAAVLIRYTEQLFPSEAHFDVQVQETWIIFKIKITELILIEPFISINVKIKPVAWRDTARTLWIR